MADSIKIITKNKKAWHDYFIIETFEAGISLSGTEIKSIRAGALNLKDSYISINNAEAFVKGMHISPYEKGNIFNKDPLRIRRLLMHKREIMRLLEKIQQDGCTLVPVLVYFKGAKVKVKIALCKGKKLYDKRQSIAKNDQRREAEKDFKVRNLSV